MDQDSAEDAAAKERLSALADGELDLSEVSRACSAWRDEHESRATWHTYQLIGDVLRSDDLASGADRDSAFLRSLRDRLAQEPIVFAPQSAAELAAMPTDATLAGAEVEVVRAPHQAQRLRRRTWVGASAVAAGFVAVAGVLVLTRSPGISPGSQPADRLALSASAPNAAMPAALTTQPSGASATLASAEPPALVANGKLIRDARLDRYLAAHKQFAGTSALGVPSGFLRAATTVEADR